jgi:transcriptional regulator with XRE-family HTH domain
MPPRRRSTPRSSEHASLGEAICLVRAERGLSQEDLADAAEMHVTHIGGLERGVRNPSYATLVRLSGALGVKPGKLVSLADELRGADSR